MEKEKQSTGRRDFYTHTHTDTIVCMYSSAYAHTLEAM